MKVFQYADIFFQKKIHIDWNTNVKI